MNNIINLADMPRQQAKCDECRKPIPPDRCMFLDGNSVLCRKCGDLVCEQASIVAEMSSPVHSSRFGKTGDLLRR